MLALPTVAQLAPIAGARDLDPVRGLTHGFYKYPHAGCHTALDTAIITAPDQRDPAMVMKLDAVAGRVLGQAARLASAAGRCDDCGGRRRPSMAQASRKSQSLYDTDFNAWLEEQAAHARAGRPAMLDLAHLVEELDGLNKSQRHEIESRLRILLAHLLKHQFQPDARTRSWLATIADQRDQIDVILRDSPSLRGYPAAVLADAYGRAKRFAAVETGLDENKFPARCPYAIDRILEAGWLP